MHLYEQFSLSLFDTTLFFFSFIYNIISYDLIKLYQSFIYTHPQTYSSNLQTIEYMYNGQVYYFCFKPKRFLKHDIQYVIDTKNDTDITDLYLSFLGPNLDCFQQKLTVKDIGFEQLKIIHYDDIMDEETETMLEENDILTK